MLVSLVRFFTLPLAVVNAFDAAESFGWVGSAFFMAQAPCMLLYGQLRKQIS